jgi:hypothetical protein
LGKTICDFRRKGYRVRIRFVNSGEDAGVVGVAEGVASCVGSDGSAVSEAVVGVEDGVGYDGSCVGEDADGVA